ncbi:MAG TPA: hypothetical protein VKP30_19400 [Polyangiaceae bacterium]|nr:hypothetical protein [Polyangiaceae bacterium]
MTNAERLFTTASVLALIGIGCDDVDWPESRYVDSLRVLAVHADPPTLTPGASTQLSVLCADGRRGASTEPTCNVEVAWFARCDNPVRNDPKNCLRAYSRWADDLVSSVADTPLAAYPDGFAFGRVFGFSAPSTILRDEFDLAGNRIRFGTSYIFFALCAGRLAWVHGKSEQLPVECRDPVTNKVLDQSRFVVGTTTVYSYDVATSRNPVLLNPRFDDVSVPEHCDTSAECPPNFDCSTENRCVPLVRRCAKRHSEDCEEHCLSLDLGLDGFSLFSLEGARIGAPTKSVWLDYLTNAGNLPGEDARFGIDAPQDDSAVQRTPCIRWQAPTVPTENAHLWAVVRDDRGGTAVWDQRIIVR